MAKGEQEEDDWRLKRAPLQDVISCLKRATIYIMFSSLVWQLLTSQLRSVLFRLWPYCAIHDDARIRHHIKWHHLTVIGTIRVLFWHSDLNEMLTSPDVQPQHLDKLMEIKLRVDQTPQMRLRQPGLATPDLATRSTTRSVDGDSRRAMDRPRCTHLL